MIEKRKLKIQEAKKKRLAKKPHTENRDEDRIVGQILTG
jgi:hypothetical protein